MPTTCDSEASRVYIKVQESTTSSSTSGSIPTATTAETTPAATETAVAGRPSTCSSGSAYCPDALPFDTTFESFGCASRSRSLTIYFSTER